MKLTEHFKLSEFSYSETAIRNGIDNTVPEQYIPSLINLCEQVLEPLREHIGEPIIISSGYRCPELNKLVGGAKNSQHMTGEAADISLIANPSSRIANPSSLIDCYTWLLNNTRFDQLIMESKGNARWIHISLCREDSKNRQHAFRLKK